MENKTFILFHSHPHVVTLMQYLLSIDKHPNYVNVSTKTDRVSDTSIHRTTTFTYKKNIFGWMIYLLPDAIVHEALTIRNESIFDFSLKQIDFTIQPCHHLYYTVKGMISFETDRAVLSISMIEFYPPLNKLPRFVLRSTEHFIEQQVRQDIQDMLEIDFTGF